MNTLSKEILRSIPQPQARHGCSTLPSLSHSATKCYDYCRGGSHAGKCNGTESVVGHDTRPYSDVKFGKTIQSDREDGRRRGSGVHVDVGHRIARQNEMYWR